MEGTPTPQAPLPSLKLTEEERYAVTDHAVAQLKDRGDGEAPVNKMNSIGIAHSTKNLDGRPPDPHPFRP
jgi:hypothetical protein